MKILLLNLILISSLAAQVGGTAGITVGTTAGVSSSGSGLVGTNNNFVFVGDSLTQGDTGAGHNYPSIIMTLPNLSGHGTGYNLGVGGYVVANLVANYTADVHPLSPAVTARPGYLFVYIGVNDLLAGTSAATIETALGGYYTTAHADGWIIVAMTIHASTTFNVDMELQRELLNGWLRGQSNNSLLSTTATWDRLVDLEAVFVNPSDRNLFATDSLHFKNATGWAAMARVIDSTIGTQEVTFWNQFVDQVGTGSGGYRSNPTACALLTSGADNSCVGPFAGYNTTTGSENLFFAREAGYTNTTGSGFVALGAYAARAASTISDITAIGRRALQQQTTNGNNVGIGSYAGAGCVSCYNSTFIGSNADVTANGPGNVIVLGYLARATAADRTVIGTNNMLDVFMGSETPSATSHQIRAQVTAVAVASLPTCTAGLEGTFAAVNNANSTTYNATVAAGGSNHMPVYCNGTNWVLH